MRVLERMTNEELKRELERESFSPGTCDTIFEMNAVRCPYLERVRVESRFPKNLNDGKNYKVIYAHCQLPPDESAENLCVGTIKETSISESNFSSEIARRCPAYRDREYT